LAVTFDRETAERVASGKDLPDERIQRVLDGVTAANYDAACQAKRLFDNFTDYVSEVAAGGATAADD
jgi:GMP synthase (glutamine-hydrolysing)